MCWGVAAGLFWVQAPLAAVIGAGTLGYLAGSLGGWAVGRAGGRPFVERYGRWVHRRPLPQGRALVRPIRARPSAADAARALVVIHAGRVPLGRSLTALPSGRCRRSPSPGTRTSTSNSVRPLALGLRGDRRRRRRGRPRRRPAGRRLDAHDHLRQPSCSARSRAPRSFPVSTLGHSVIAPRLLGWDIHQDDPFFLSFLVATHLATALVLVGFFWDDWKRIAGGLCARSATARSAPATATPDWAGCSSRHDPRRSHRPLAEHPLRGVFASPDVGGGLPALNGVMLFGAERLRRARRRSTTSATATSASRALASARPPASAPSQAIGLLPGFSRSGATMAGGLLAGLSNEDSARFAFLLATPIIGAAAVLKLPDLLGPDGDGVRGPALVGALCAALTTYIAVRSSCSSSRPTA